MTGAPAQGTGGGSAGSAGHAAPPRARRVACRKSSRLQDAPGLNSVCLCVCAFLVDPKPAGAGAWLGLEEATRPRPRQTMGKKARLPTAVDHVLPTHPSNRPMCGLGMNCFGLPAHPGMPPEPVDPSDPTSRLAGLLLVLQPSRQARRALGLWLAESGAFKCSTPSTGQPNRGPAHLHQRAPAMPRGQQLQTSCTWPRARWETDPGIAKSDMANASEQNWRGSARRRFPTEPGTHPASCLLSPVYVSVSSPTWKQRGSLAQVHGPWTMTCQHWTCQDGRGGVRSFIVTAPEGRRFVTPWRVAHLRIACLPCPSLSPSRPPYKRQMRHVTVTEHARPKYQTTTSTVE
ncbi:hypothetical protein X797_005482 [Metarhizium robertsii]|uniref:Uncharacterized protein n=1 Tax=Metarhizium robertsii TaxID=568076 RepID=A0A014PT01_9HYPO|nr:hypothetical protein X797_005482 [Metarhizium robertsii]